MGGKSSPIKIIEDIVQSSGKAVTDVLAEGGKVLGGDINLDPLNKQKEEAKDAARADAKQQAAATVAQKEAAQAQIKVKAANKDASAGSSIVLGGKRKKGKGSSVSSGLGLSKGSTGLQT